MALPLQYAKVVMFFADTAGVRIENVFWYELVGTFGGGYDINAAAIALQNHFNTHLLAWLSSDAVYNGIDVRINNHGVTADASTYPASNGTGSAFPMPNEVAAIVHWQTGTPGRSGRGRSFFTLCANDFIKGGRLTPTGNTALANLATDLKTNFTDQGISWQLRLHSRLLDQLIPIASFVVNVLLGTQRKRRPPR